MKKKVGFFLRIGLTIIDLFEGLWLAGDTFSPLPPVLPRS